MSNINLKKLELSGFKSFAKPSRFNFPKPITAIVGPNGSGKSNVAEALRWVLGEQSVRSLRGKKGEDLIFSGSMSAPRLSKASVLLTFDNALRRFPLEFGEVEIGRRIYRDGQSEYLLNGSPVRLKDIIELLSNVGLGVSQHHIIGQGEADKILYSSPKERQQALEDALGLKIYQFKRMEAERKLARTEENMRQAQALQKEIRPHLKHLERLVERQKQSSEIKEKLRELLKDYLSKFEAEIKSGFSKVSSEKNKPEAEIEEIRKKTILLKSELSSLGEAEERPEELKKTEEAVSEARAGKNKIERELGRLEGMIETLVSAGSDEGETIPREEIESMLSELNEHLSSAMETDVVEEIYSIIQEALSRISAFLGGVFSSGAGETAGNRDMLLKKKKEIESALAGLEEKERKLLKKQEELNSAFYSAGMKRRQLEQEIFGLENKTNSLRDSLREAGFEEEKLRMRSQELEKEKEEARVFFEEEPILEKRESGFEEGEREKAQKEINRLKFRLEETGTLDKDTLKEYEEIKERDEFFSKELEDLGRASKGLRQISRELAEKIEEDFRGGVEKINKELQKFFETMFGGGKARLVVLKAEKIRKSDEEIEEVEGSEEPPFAEASGDKGGVDIDVSLPRKKIKGLNMLSGGERALTSIALLFAMSAVNPPPFLVLDETDAALDESNSRRYGELLRELSRTTQIITITHNRETMKQAGALYGITMGSDGVSRMLSLKFAEAEEIAQ